MKIWLKVINSRKKKFKRNDKGTVKLVPNLF